MPITLLDMIVMGIVLVSALLAALRGFTREVLAIGSWVVAAVAAYLLYPQALPYAREYVSTNQTIALAVAVAGIFFTTLVIAYFVTSKLSDIILDSRIGALDRTLGFLFGAARGLLLAVVAFLFFDWLVAERQRPSWVTEARLRPLLEQSGAWIKAQLPENPDQFIRERARPLLPDADAPREPAPAPGNRSAAPPPDRAALERMLRQGQPAR